MDTTDLDARLRERLIPGVGELFRTDPYKNALRAVLDVHSRCNYVSGTPRDTVVKPYCVECTRDAIVDPAYPCPTVRAIARELLGDNE